MLLDRLVRTLSALARSHGGHQHLGGGKEWQVAFEFGIDHSRERPETVEHRQERFQQSVHRVAGVRQRHSADHRTRDVPFVPLLTREVGGHRRVAAQKYVHTVDALARASVHLVRHRRRADLPWTETLGGEFMTGHQSHRGGEVRRRGRKLHQRAQDVVVQGPRIHLANACQRRVEPEVFGHTTLELRKLVAVTVEKIKHVLRSPDRSLDATHRISIDEHFEAVQPEKHLLRNRGKAFAQRGDLSGDVVGATSHGGFGVRDG